MRYARKGLGLAYNFILVALTSLLFVIYAMAMLNSTLFAAKDGKKPLFDDAIAQITEQMPEMIVENGIVTVTSPQPHYIKLRVTLMGNPVEGTLMTIDTTGTTTHQNMRTPLLLTNKEIIARSKDEIKIHPISEYHKPGEPPLNLDRTTIQKFSELVVRWVHDNIVKLVLGVSIVLWLSVTLFLYLMRLAMVLALGVAGLVIGSITKSPIDYAAAMRLSALAYTPVTVADAAVMALTGHPLPHGILFVLGVVMLHSAMQITRSNA